MFSIQPNKVDGVTQNFSFWKIILLVACSLVGNSLFSQNARAFLMEPELRVYIASDSSRWAYSVGLAHRGLLLESLEVETGEEDYEHEHLEINGFTEYSLNENSNLVLRIRYRLREIFDDEKYDESRIIEQYDYAHPNSQYNLWHRFRFEQRLQNIKTTFRWRYRFGILPTLSEEFALSVSTEALYSVSRKAKPEAEQRFYTGFQNTSFENVELNMGLELRVMDYANNLQSEYFLFTSVLLYL